jgi:hypothetical protein
MVDGERKEGAVSYLAGMGTGVVGMEPDAALRKCLTREREFVFSW